MIEAFAEVFIDSSIFDDNSALKSGGAISSSSYLELTSTNFTSNAASAFNGNDIYFKGQDSLVLDKVMVNASKGVSIFVWSREFKASGLLISSRQSSPSSSSPFVKGIVAF